MPDFEHLVYINPDPQAHIGLPGELRTFQILCWEKSAHIRWRVAVAGQVAAALRCKVLLVIVDCSADLDTLRKTCEDIRAVSQSPVLLLVPTSSTGRTVPAPAVTGAAVEMTKRALSDTAAISQVLQQLGVIFPTQTFHLDYNKHHVAMAEIVQLVSEERLKLTIQKFFPSATGAKVRPVAGGWSGARLCRLFIEGNEYFLKFFEDSGKYRRELERHNQACQWLVQAEAAVDLRPVPDVDPSPLSQMEAFPQVEPMALPVCYASASPPGEQRETLKELYRTKDDKFLDAAFTHLLDVLETGQPDPPHLLDDVPWGFQAGGNPLFLDRIKGRILAALEDLERYGPSLCAENTDEWQKRRDKLELLALGSVPDWLAVKGAKVACGFSHGDPNPRNCLVLPGDAKNLRLIDCGDFDSHWRLVSDLAQVEREIKLVLMGTEDHAVHFHDLNTGRFQEWCEAERSAVSRKLDYRPQDAPVAGKGTYLTAARAYRLIGMVRQRAKKQSGMADDKAGVHYFAALLFWTLDALRYKEVRRTKKLFALYSASEILQAF